MAEDTHTTLERILRETRAMLARSDIDDPGLESRLLVEHLTGTTRAHAITAPKRPVDLATANLVAEAVARRLEGEPIHRILGFREFYGLELLLSPETLEPRPDTETLIDAMLPVLRETAKRHGTCRILDLGTGTGAIALALLSQIETTTAVGVDISAGALETAARNADLLGLGARFAPVHSDWFSAVSGRFHAIVSNPPYISSMDIGALQIDVRKFDPLVALDGGRDGLDAYRTISAHAADHLEQGGTIGVEIGYDQRASVSDIFHNAGFRLIKAQRDLGGNDRVLLFQA